MERMFGISRLSYTLVWLTSGLVCTEISWLYKQIVDCTCTCLLMLWSFYILLSRGSTLSVSIEWYWTFGLGANVNTRARSWVETYMRSKYGCYFIEISCYKSWTVAYWCSGAKQGWFSDVADTGQCWLEHASSCGERWYLSAVVVGRWSTEALKLRAYYSRFADSYKQSFESSRHGKEENSFG